MSQPALRLTMLVQNSVQRRQLLAEHGLAVWIETPSARILFDTGQGYVLRHNAETLGIDLQSADALVVSHGHYDHTGGLNNHTGLFKSATIYAHLTAFRKRYIQRDDGSAESVGSPVATADQLRTDVADLKQVRQSPGQIAEGVWITGEIPRQTEFEDTGGAFFLDPECRTSDPVVDDQAMYLETSRGLVVLFGCAHAGVVNTLNHIREISNDTPIHAMIGGFHLLHASEHRMQETITAIKACDPAILSPAHCTGHQATRLLEQQFPNAFRQCPVGTVFEFD